MLFVYLPEILVPAFSAFNFTGPHFIQISPVLRTALHADKYSQKISLLCFRKLFLGHRITLKTPADYWSKGIYT